MIREVPPPVANPENGEVLLQVKGPHGDVKEAFVLRVGTNAACELEKAMGDHIHKLGPRLMNPGMTDLRCLVHAALNEHHPLMTQRDVGNLLDRVGYDVALAAVMEAFTLGFRRPPGAPEPAADGNRKGPGTGNGSSPTPRRQGSARRSSGPSRPVS